MTLRRVQIATGGGGGAPFGSAVMTDAVGLFAVVNFADAIAGQSDVAAFNLAVAYADGNAALLDTILTRVAIADALGAQLDVYSLRLLIADTVAAQAESVRVNISGLADVIAAQLEAIRTGFSGYVDSNQTPGESISNTVRTWATSNSSSGTAPVNPTNAQGENNGTTATVKAGGVANGTSTLTLTIPRTSIPATGAKTLLAYYQTVAGSTDTFTITYTDTGGNPATATLPSGNFLTTPYSLALTALHVTNNPTVAFTHAATTPSLGGQINVDAVTIESAEATSL